MDILKILFHVVKAGLLFAPLLVAGWLLVRLDAGQKRICSILSIVSGIGTGIFFNVAALFTRSNFPWVQMLFGPESERPRHVSLHLPFPNLFDGFTTDSSEQIKLHFLGLWNDQFSSFWTDVLNPFKAPWIRTISDIASVPHGNGVVFFAVLIGLGLLSILIAQLVDKSGMRQLKSLALLVFAAWYVASLGAWLGPIVGTVLVLIEFGFLFLARRVMVLRAGDVVHVS